MGPNSGLANGKPATGLNMAAGSTELDGVHELASVLPRVLIVSRRTVRKNKFVDFVGEYHLDLIVKYGAVPVIVPRVDGLASMLDSFEPIHGVLLCEGEDIDPSHYAENSSSSDLTALSLEEQDQVAAMHASDSTIDAAKDSIELALARRCLERNVPYMGICRGSQVLNVACGGSLYRDVELELGKRNGVDVKHMDYSNYDGHRHPIEVLPGTPLASWFQQSLEKDGHGKELLVNSYHHQGVKRLATRFQPMALAPDGLVEAFYDPDTYDPPAGKFIVGLQFHPERMRHHQDASPRAQKPGPVDDCQLSELVFDYPECPRAYQEFAAAVNAYQRRLLQSEAPEGQKVAAAQSLNGTGLRPAPEEGGALGGGALAPPPRGPLDRKMERQLAEIVRSFSVARTVYDEEHQLKHNASVHGGNAALAALTFVRSRSQKQLTRGADFLLESTAVNAQMIRRMSAVGVTVRNSSKAMEQLAQGRLGASPEGGDGGSDKADTVQLLQGLATDDLAQLHATYRRLADLAGQVLAGRQPS